MTKEGKNGGSEQQSPAVQQQMSPLAASSLLAAIVLGYVFYSTSDVLRASMISAIAFLGPYWVMSRGQAMEAKRAKLDKQDKSEGS